MKKEELQYFLKEHYGMTGQLSQLPGSEDINFLVDSSSGKFVLKISKPPFDLSYLDFQVALLDCLSQLDQSVSPKVIKSKSGKKILYYSSPDNQRYAVRLYTWLAGKTWAKTRFRTVAAYQSYGRLLGNTCQALSGFDHPYAQREMKWDLAQAKWIEPFLPITGEWEGVVQKILNTFLHHAEVYESLPKQVIHNDGNDYNVLTSEGIPNALIDYGDAIFTQRINELAIGVAYAIMGSSDPLMAAYHVVQGFHGVINLTESEVTLLYNLVALRLGVSIVVSYQNLADNPDNEYLQISAEPAKKLLHKWMEISPRKAEIYFRQAAKMIPIKNYNSIVSYLESHKISLNELLVSENDWCPKVVDLHINNDLIYEAEVYHNPAKMEYILEGDRVSAEANVSYGGYLECRSFYNTPIYEKEGISGPKQRTIHLGEDYWVKAGTKVLAPLDGEVIAIHDNNAIKDYGPMIILRHSTDDNQLFYSLYGHLDRECLDRLQVGDHVEKGEWLARIGSTEENGSWAPHLHFQLILDRLHYHSDFPGVWYPDEVSVWKYICPDPKVFIDLDHYPTFEEQYNVDQLMESRNRLLGPSLSLSYDDPLLILKGEMQYLIDQNGQKYLDLVNNVAHVGHEHPSVVTAAKKQIAKLNTNTRYLHPLILDYAADLLNKFSDDFTRVYLVNSGSEANELALRMAKTASGGDTMLAMDHGYHGNTNKTIAVSAYKFSGKGGGGKPQNTILLPMLDAIDYQSSDRRYFQALIDKAVSTLQNENRRLIGYIGESILSCGGQVKLPHDYIRAIYQSVKQQQGYFIVDEVQTGFGRMGECFWAYELYGITPDIVTLGKPIGNGHPIGAVVCTEEVAQAFSNGMEFFSTYGGNPVSCAIGSEVLKVIERENLQQKALELGKYFMARLQKLADNHPVIAKVSGQGLFLGLTFILDNKPAAQYAHDLVQAMRGKHILLSTDGPFHNVVKIKPPMCITKEDVDRFVELLDGYLQL